MERRDGRRHGVPPGHRTDVGVRRRARVGDHHRWRPRCQFQVATSPRAGNRAFEHFYFDTDGIQTALVETWGKLAENSRMSRRSRASTC